MYTLPARVKVFYLLSASVLFFTYGCCTNKLINLSAAKEKVIEYYESGLYEQETSDAVKEAEEIFGQFELTSSSAVIFDIDETALSNYEIDKQLDFGYIKELFDAWIDSAKAPAVKPVKKLYDFLVSKNYKIIFLTGRRTDQYNATVKNLYHAGYTSFDTLITRKPEEHDLTAVVYKTAKRKELTAKGYLITGTVGDQWSDLEGDDHGIQVKIPNYSYIIE